MFITRKKFDKLVNELAAEKVLNEMYSVTIKGYIDALDAEKKESNKWRERCHELYKEKEA